MDAKFDAYEGFDPTQTEGGGCSCEGGVYWDMITQTWKQGKVVTPKASADCSQVEAALKQAQAEKAKADEKASKAEQAKEAAETEAETARLVAANANAAKDQAERDKEAAQASEATAIAKAEKTQEYLNEALAELVTKQNEIAELKRKLEECQKDKCPEVDVVSLGDETVFSGNSCDEVVGLNAPRQLDPEDHL